MAAEIYKRILLKTKLWLPYALCFGALFLACHCGDSDQEPEWRKGNRFPRATQTGKFFKRDGVKYLWGGDSLGQDFVVDNLMLEPSQFYFGVGREYFPALLTPEFVTASEASKWLPDSLIVLGFVGNDAVKAYPLALLERHEVINDMDDGHPIVVIFCNLADFAAIYDRSLDGRTLTYGQAGYVYSDPKVAGGKYGFILWDRETESLWWPLIERAVSGPLRGTRMNIYNHDKWRLTSWREWQKAHPGTLVLQRDQDFERPTSWPHFQTN